MEIQRAMFAANLRSSQEALAFLGRMQSSENLQEVYRNKIQKISRGYSRKAEIKEEVVVTVLGT